MKVQKGIGLALIALSVAVLVFLNQKGKNVLEGREIPVLTKTVVAGELITEDMIEIQTIYCREKCLEITDIQSIIGKESVQYVHKGVPLFTAYFAESEMTPDGEKGNYLLDLKAEFVLNGVNEVKKGDMISLYHGSELLVRTKVVFMASDFSRFTITTKEEDVFAINEVIDSSGKMILVRG